MSQRRQTAFALPTTCTLVVLELELDTLDLVSEYALEVFSDAVSADPETNSLALPNKPLLFSFVSCA